ncbi:PREDICTED: molybdenum cofactor sulfurase [Cyphomyrmex costatus]|uniref:molybdenum cofactor sulfurase n=1 Tax=Cyphomyrmex costatus TaxID=456900 RepID=UPI0008522FF6|nr:PREDICTED: molybdenum cofactor sulfurase [Cyphomyrmex costatus]
MEDIVKFTPVYDDATARLLASEFTRLEGECYVDHAGTTLYSETQIKNAGANLHGCLYGNPHSTGNSKTLDIIERMRYRILSHFNTNADEYTVIFTSGATASLKIVAEGFRFTTDEKKIATSPHSGSFVYVQDNHMSVLGMRDVIAVKGADVIYLDHDQAFHIFNQPPTCRDSNETKSSNSLFVYSAQCNFSGLKYPLKWISDAHAGALSVFVRKPSTRWYVLLDAASFAATNKLDLSVFKPDFVCLSFYKMFGYPTGIGALLVKNTSSDVLDKTYYGGGTVDIALSSERFHRKREILYQRFEDGTVPFLSIVSLQYGFEILSKLTMDRISKHVFSLAKTLHHSLLILHHCNGKPVVKLYSDSDYEDRRSQGGIVTFNVMRSNGEHVGYMKVLNMAALFKIHLRTGCFCNPGACQRHLSFSTKEILKYYEAGYVCGGETDLVNGKPIGACILKRLFIYPIKSCGAHEITDSWNLNSKGLEFDKEWMIITSSGTCLTQKHHTNLYLLKPVILRKQNIMRLTYPGRPTIDIPLENVYEKSIEYSTHQNTVYESKVQSIDCGSKVSEWLSLALGKPNLKLIRRSRERQKNELNKAELSNQTQYLAVNEASMSWFIDKISDDLDFLKDAMHQFKSNIIVGGCEAFDEMQWEHVRIGNNNFKVNGPCTKCQMISLDQTIGEKTIEPLRTLTEEFHEKLRFGICLTRLEKTQSTLKIGDYIYFS